MRPRSVLQGPLPRIRPCALGDLERSPSRTVRLHCLRAHPTGSPTVFIHFHTQGWGRRAGAQRREGQLHLEVLGVQRRRRWRRAFWNELVSGKAGTWGNGGAAGYEVTKADEGQVTGCLPGHARA